MQGAGFRPAPWPWPAQFSDENLNFSAQACECLEFKHRLAALVDGYCPEVMPETHYIDDLNWSMVLSQLADRDDEAVWILKPSLLNNGQHIRIFESWNRLEDHFLSTDRLGGPHVLQRYLVDSDCLDGCKYSLRYFVVIAQGAGAFLYPQGYMNQALEPYPGRDFSKPRAHLTNEHLDDQPTVQQIPTLGHPKAKLWEPSVYRIASAVTQALEQAYPEAYQPSKQPAFAVFGFDFMMDSDHRLWLLEVNHGPCFPSNDEHPLQAALYSGFWPAVVDQFVEPIVRGRAIRAEGGFLSLRA